MGGMEGFGSRGGKEVREKARKVGSERKERVGGEKRGKEWECGEGGI